MWNIWQNHSELIINFRYAHSSDCLVYRPLTSAKETKPVQQSPLNKLLHGFSSVHMCHIYIPYHNVCSMVENFSPKFYIYERETVYSSKMETDERDVYILCGWERWVNDFFLCVFWFWSDSEARYTTTSWATLLLWKIFRFLFIFFWVFFFYI